MVSRMNLEDQRMIASLRLAVVISLSPWSLCTLGSWDNNVECPCSEFMNATFSSNECLVSELYCYLHSFIQDIL